MLNKHATCFANYFLPLLIVVIELYFSDGKLLSFSNNKSRISGVNVLPPPAIRIENFFIIPPPFLT